MNPILDESNFVAGDVQEREVELGDGKKYPLKFKRLTGVEQYAFAVAQNSTDDNAKVRSIARLVSVCLVGDDELPVLSVDQAMKLKDGVLHNLLVAAREVNQGVAEKKASVLEASATSGT